MALSPNLKFILDATSHILSAVNGVCYAVEPHALTPDDVNELIHAKANLVLAVERMEEMEQRKKEFFGEIPSVLVKVVPPGSPGK